MTDYRIRKYDQKNWVIEELILPRKISIGPHKGKMSNPRWDIYGYYGKLDHMLPALVELHIPIGANPKTIEELKQLLENTKAEILSKLEQMYWTEQEVKKGEKNKVA